MKYKVVDTHTAGEPTRIVTNLQTICGGTMTQVRERMQADYDWFRRFLLQEPRGHSDMFGAILFPPKRRECDIGVIFMDNGGYLNMCGHGTIAVVTCAVQTSIIKPRRDILLDTSAGIIRARVKYRGRRAQSVTFENVLAFKLKTSEIAVADRRVRVDIAFGGNFFAHVDADEVGIDIEPENTTAIIDLGVRIRNAVNAQEKIVHPEHPEINKVELVEFSGQPRSKGADAQNVVVFGRGQIDRSPCGTGTCAKMALLHSEGKLKVGDLFIHESILRTKFTGRLLAETKVGDYEAVVPEITGSAYITGLNQLIFDERDPLREGFLL